jgi:hypothetical protein
LPDNLDFPLDHHTLRLRAVFVPDGAEVSMAEITQAVGPHPVRIPAVLVPDGGTLPGYPYEHIGRAVFIPDEADDQGLAGQLGWAEPPHALPATSRQNDSFVPENPTPLGPRWFPTVLASASGLRAPATAPSGGDQPSGVSAST